MKNVPFETLYPSTETSEEDTVSLPSGDSEQSAEHFNQYSGEYKQSGRNLKIVALLLAGVAFIGTPFIVIMLRLGEYLTLMHIPWQLWAGLGLMAASVGTLIRSKDKTSWIIIMTLLISAVILFLITASYFSAVISDS